MNCVARNVAAQWMKLNDKRQSRQQVLRQQEETQIQYSIRLPSSKIGHTCLRATSAEADH